ncbi:family 16 glycosylhydrolase [Hirschia litorea]|uniref:Beta-glucanase n=1 Tax=Hirschia litorea TaxID=1199156 RepID=A0ABW2IGN6_9PROT
MNFFKSRQLSGSLLMVSLSALLTASSVTTFGVFASAEKANSEIHSDQIPYSNPNNRELLDSFVKTFEAGHDYTKWYISNFIIEDDFFQNGWTTDNTIFMENGDVALALTHRKMAKKPFSGAEYQKKGWSQYGRYETIMTSAPGSGIVTGFFTHTNDYFKDPHDEIDIEFLGKDTQSVQFNIYRDGREMGGHTIKLPYDASEEFHLYAFEWTPTEVRWFIDDKLMFTATDRDFDIPDAPQRLMMQIWTGNIFEWHGKARFADGASAVFRCVSYTRLNDDSAEKCSDKPELLSQSVVELIENGEITKTAQNNN